REDDDLRGTIASVARSYAAGRDLLDGVRDELHVVAVEHRIPIVGEHHALAADLVGGCDLRAQRGIRDRLVDLAAAKRAKRRQQRRLARHRKGTELVEGEVCRAVESLE